MIYPKVTKMVLGFVFSDYFDQMLMIEKNRPYWQAGKLNAIGGKVEPDECFSGAMRREFVEETGLALTNFIQFADLHFVMGQVVIRCFAAKMPLPELLKFQSLTDEKVKAVSMVHDLPENTIENLHWLIPMAKRSIVMSTRYLNTCDVPFQVIQVVDQNFIPVWN